MLKRILVSIALVLFLAASASADPAAVGKKVSEAFQKACSAGDVPGVMALYEDDATAIWPGQGEVAKGKEAIQKLVTANCKPSVMGSLELKSQDSKAIGRDYILNVGRWENTVTGPDGKPEKMDVRTTEILHRSNRKWRYFIDHASVGLPPPSPAGAEKPSH
jgi:uncharacterized protein (TIGR02246 family)